jgi:hypothetical protein
MANDNFRFSAIFFSNKAKTEWNRIIHNSNYKFNLTVNFSQKEKNYPQPIDFIIIPNYTA